MTRSKTSAFVIAGRALLLVAAAGAAGIAVVAGRADGPAAHAHGSYVCPMHPDVTSSGPGDCSICKMALEPVSPARAGSGDSAGDSWVLPESAKLFRFDDVAMTKQYITSQEMRVHAWVETPELGVALLHTDQAELLKPGEAALFSPSGPASGTAHGVEVHVTDEPATAWDRATRLVRFRIDPAAGLTPGRTGSLKFATRLRKGLVVKASAVRSSPSGPYVLLVADDRRTLRRRPVEIGSVIYGYAAVISGLEQGEYVAAKHTFTLDAEQRLSVGGGS